MKSFLKALIILMSFMSFNVEASERTMYFGIVEPGSGFGMTGHVFILSSTDKGILPTDQVYEYNLEVNTLAKSTLNKMNVIEKVDHFFNSAFKVYKKDFDDYLMKYRDLGRGVKLYRFKLPQEQLNSFYLSIHKDYIARKNKSFYDYDFFENNCLTIIYERLRGVVSQDDLELLTSGFFSNAPFSLEDKLSGHEAFYEPITIKPEDDFSDIYIKKLEMLDETLTVLCPKEGITFPSFRDGYDSANLKDYLENVIPLVKTCDNKYVSKMWLHFYVSSSYRFPDL